MRAKVDIGQGTDSGRRLRHVLAWAMIDWGGSTDVDAPYKFAMTVVRSLLILSALLLAACDKAGTSTELPRPTTGPTTIVSFNGTLKLLTTDTYSFTVSQDGYVEATLIGLAAPAGTKVGLAIGTPSLTGACTANHTVTTEAGPTAQIVGTGIAGSLCITITDIGNLKDPALYTITVATS
jgi:hypothetical protein